MYTAQLSGKLYRVYRLPLETNSAVFASMLSLPQDQSSADFVTEGMTDEAPVILDGVPVSEFDSFLSVLYPMCVLHVP
jgi:hypothetical protein